MRRLLPTLLALTIVACGPAGLREADTTTALALGPRVTRRLETMTDLEQIRGALVLGDSVYVATDTGLLRYGAGEAPAAERVAGLPGEDVRAIVADGESLLVATTAGLVQVAGDVVTPVSGVPNIGEPTAMARTSDGTVWLGGLLGLARRTADGWQVFGEPVRCTTLAPTPEGQLWVGTASGLWYVEGDVVREHPISGGIPDGYVRSVVPVMPGKILALVQGPSYAQLGYWDGEFWSAYTLRGLSGHAVALVRRGDDVLLVGQRILATISLGGAGVGLVPLASARGNVRSFRARITPAAQHTPPAPSERETLQDAKPFAPVPENRASVAAPPLSAERLELDLPGRLEGGFVHGPSAFLAITNGGVLHLPERGAPRVLRSRSLVPDEPLQVAADGGGTAWLVAREGRLAKYTGGRFVRSALPVGLVAQAVAPGPEGAYLLALDPSAGPNAVRLFVNRGSGWASLAQRTLALPTPLVGVPFMGVSPEGAIWAALRVRREEGEGARPRGFAVIEPANEAVLLHHRGAEQPSLPVPDEVSSVEFDTEGNAWIASLSGLVRAGNHQAVVFGEARGVRGELVSDAAFGSAAVWLASAEGLASYDRTRFDYALPTIVREARPSRIAIELGGTIWAASANGLLVRSGEEWRRLDEAAGLPTRSILDVQADTAGRVWLLAADRLLMLSAP